MDTNNFSVYCPLLSDCNLNVRVVFIYIYCKEEEGENKILSQVIKICQFVFVLNVPLNILIYLIIQHIV